MEAIDYPLNLESLIERADSLEECIDGDGMEIEMMAELKGMRAAIEIMSRPESAW